MHHCMNITTFNRMIGVSNATEVGDAGHSFVALVGLESERQGKSGVRNLTIRRVKSVLSETRMHQICWDIRVVRFSQGPNSPDLICGS